jgi:AraC-like DNA-binding protein
MGSMLILRQMPDPLRLTPVPANAAFRRAFYSRWGKEDCIILARARGVEYPPFTQRLSIKSANGGTERYFLSDPARTVGVDEDHFLVLNDGRTYASAIERDCVIESYSIFFAPGLAAHAHSALRTSVSQALAGNASTAADVEFIEYLQPHDDVVTPMLAGIRRRVLAGFDDTQWYEEQLHLLAERLVAQRTRVSIDADSLSALKPATRTEVLRRVLLATDHLHVNFDQDVSLDALAAVACLSKFHFLRLFRQVHGLTPYAFLQRKRARVANRLIATTRLTMEQIATRVGYGSRSQSTRAAHPRGLAGPRSLGRRQPEQNDRLRRTTMTRTLSGLITGLLLATLGSAETTPGASQQPAATTPQPPGKPCASGRYREFDFWVGRWDVRGPKGKLAGENTITLEEDGCVVVEHWRSAGGGTGQSISYYDPKANRWKQKWVGLGLLLEMDGRFENGAMVLEGPLQYLGTDRETILRTTWSRLDDGRVRHTSVESDDGGKTWKPWFDGYYSKKAG